MSKYDIVIELTEEQIAVCKRYASAHGESLYTVISAMKNLLWRKSYNRLPEMKAKRRAYNRRMGSLRSRLNDELSSDDE